MELDDNSTLRVLRFKRCFTSINDFIETYSMHLPLIRNQYYNHFKLDSEHEAHAHSVCNKRFKKVVEKQPFVYNMGPPSDSYNKISLHLGFPFNLGDNVVDYGFDETCSYETFHGLLTKFQTIHLHGACNTQHSSFGRRVYINKNQRGIVTRSDNGVGGDFYIVNDMNVLADFISEPMAIHDDIPMIRFVVNNVSPLVTKVPENVKDYDSILEQEVDQFKFHNVCNVEFIKERRVGVGGDTQIYKIVIDIIPLTSESGEQLSQLKEYIETILSVIVYGDVMEEYNNIYKLFKGFR